MEKGPPLPGPIIGDLVGQLLAVFRLALSARLTEEKKRAGVLILSHRDCFGLLRFIREHSKPLLADVVRIPPREICYIDANELEARLRFLLPFPVLYETARDLVRDVFPSYSITRHPLAMHIAPFGAAATDDFVDQLAASVIAEHGTAPRPLASNAHTLYYDQMAALHEPGSAPWFDSWEDVKRDARAAKTPALRPLKDIARDTRALGAEIRALQGSDASPHVYSWEEITEGARSGSGDGGELKKRKSPEEDTPTRVLGTLHHEQRAALREHEAYARAAEEREDELRPVSEVLKDVRPLTGAEIKAAQTPEELLLFRTIREEERIREVLDAMEVDPAIDALVMDLQAEWSRTLSVLLARNQMAERATRIPSTMHLLRADTLLPAIQREIAALPARTVFNFPPDALDARIHALLTPSILRALVASLVEAHFPDHIVEWSADGVCISPPYL